MVEYTDYDTQLKLGNGHTYYRYAQQLSNGTYVATDKAILSATNSNTITIALNNTNAYRVGQQIDVGTGSLGLRDNSTQASRTITKIEACEGGGQTITFDGAPIDIEAGSHGIWSCAQNTGSADTLGMKSGYVGLNGKSAVAYRGIEGFFGNSFQFIDGIKIKPMGEIYISYKSTNYSSDKLDDDYEYVGYLVQTSNGYAKTLGYSESNPLIAITTSTTAYDGSLKDCYWTSNKNYNRVALVGGHAHAGDFTGAFYWALNNTSKDEDLYAACRVIK